MAIGAWAGVHSKSLLLLGGKSLQHQIIQVDETMEQAPRWIQLERKPSLREVHLDHMCALSQTTANFSFLLGNQGVKILFS